MRSTANKSTTPRMNPSWQKRSGGRKPVPVLLHPLAEGIEPHWRAGAEQILQTEGRLERRCSGFRRKVYGDNTTKYAQNHWNLSKVFPERGRLIIMNVQISTSGCVLCVCGEKTVLPRKEIPKNTQDTTVNLS